MQRFWFMWFVVWPRQRSSSKSLPVILILRLKCCGAVMWGMRCKVWCLAFMSWHFPSAIILGLPFGLTRRTENMSKYCPHGEFSRRHQFSRKKNSVSALDSSGSFLLVFLSDGEGGCFFIKILHFLEWGGGSYLLMWTESVLAHPVFIPLFTASSVFL